LIKENAASEIGEWMRFVQERVEQNLKGFDELMSCRTVQDCLAVQTRLVRDNIEASLQSVRRTSELSTKLTDDAAKQMSALGGASASRIAPVCYCTSLG
jgi:hypothetical protein